jgi:hypothetical protein
VAQEGNALLYSRLPLTDLRTSARRAGEKKRKICSSQGPACVVHNDSQASTPRNQPGGRVRMPLQYAAEPPSDGHGRPTVPGYRLLRGRRSSRLVVFIVPGRIRGEQGAGSESAISETRFSTKPSGVLIGMWWAARRRFFIRRARAPKTAASRQGQLPQRLRHLGFIRTGQAR